MSWVLTHPEIAKQRPQASADVAVSCEPVSRARFLDNREIDREFSDFASFAGILAARWPEYSTT
jgi:hypothetical protein